MWMEEIWLFDRPQMREGPGRLTGNLQAKTCMLGPRRLFHGEWR